MEVSRGFAAVVVAVTCLLAGGTVHAADTPAETNAPNVNVSASAARAMLERAVVAVKADEPKALTDFKAGADGFRDNDLYVFCARLDGKVDAHIDPAQIGRNIKDLYDIDGVAFGQEMMATAREGKVMAISYMWPKPATHAPASKVTFFTRVADQVCGVGYYK